MRAKVRFGWLSFAGGVGIALAACGGTPAGPAKTPPPAQNAAPIVTASFDGPSECIPLPAKGAAPLKPCTVPIVVQATDPDGDPLSYSWSGCASGSSPRATCTVDRPGPVPALVEVSDNHGHKATAEISATGVNHTPNIQIGYVTLLPNSSSIQLLGNPIDPEEGFLCGRQYCVSASSSGACGRVTLLDCTCLAGLEAEVQRTSTTGTCDVSFTLKDSWGASGPSVFSFDVSKLAAAVASVKRD
jgi:hypothetical protein